MSQRDVIYLDYNATTPVDPQVLEAMLPYFTEKFGNAASLAHAYGIEANYAVDQARQGILRAIGAEPKEDSLIFTSGATESNNLVIKGLALLDTAKKIHVISQKTEHKCVLESLEVIQKWGHAVTLLDVDPEGKVNPDDLQKALRPETALVSIMQANNEIGTIQDIKRLAKITHENSGALFHTDAAQTLGKIPVDVKALDVDLMTFSAHKLYGPKGIGVLYVAPRKPRIRLFPLLHGGGHEFGLRSGTLNVPAIVGFARAVELCLKEMPVEMRRLSALRNQIIIDLKSRLEFVHLNGDPRERLPNNINLCLEYIDADELMTKLTSVAVASGAACSSGSTEPSYVIQSLGRSRDYAKSCVRISLGRYTSEEEIKVAVEEIVERVGELRKKSLLYQMRSPLP